MIRIAQFGTGNFLRAFADLYFDTLNREAKEKLYSITVIKPTPGELPVSFQQQNNLYTVCLRGVEKGAVTESIYKVSVLDDVINPFENINAFYALARDPELALILSNTTEAGIEFREDERYDDFQHSTFPSKLTKLLYARFQASLPGVCILPTELIDDNAQALLTAVESYSKLWGLPEAFNLWNQKENVYCNTLVDRIVSGFPQDAIVKEHLFNMIGKEDRLLSVGEPFGLWVIENKGNLKSLIREGEHNIRVVLADSIDYYKKRKVRVLNGSHTNMVALGLMLGQQTVYDCITNPGINAFFKASLEEIIPFVDENVQDTRAFAADVEERFLNPFLNHQLLSIALNSISKWKSRVLPTFKAYYQANKNIPPMLTIGFSYLMALYSTRCYDLKDEQAILHYFRQGNSIEGFMAKADVWGEDLTQYPGFAETVSVQVKAILAGEKLYENR